MRFIPCALIALLAASCNDSTSDLLSFGSSDCKNSEDGEGIVSALVTPVKSADYGSLFCVSYQASGADALKVDLINEWANCVGGFDGSADASKPGTLVIEYRKSDCDVMANCSCPYDFSYEVTGLATDADLTLTLNRWSCAHDELFCGVKTRSCRSRPPRAAWSAATAGPT